MSKYFSLILALTLLLSSIPRIACAGQSEPVTVGRAYKIYSRILKEERTVWVRVPYLEGNSLYSSRSAFPVMYVLDGDAHFVTSSGIVHYLSEENGNRECPNMIVVGLLNTERTRDLTPTKDADMQEASGGGPQLMAFMRDELFPFIDSLCHPAPYRMLVGHSYGGLFALMALTDYPGLFQSYVAIDPSVFWDNERFLGSVMAKFRTKSYEHKSLFLTIANNAGFEGEVDELKRDTSAETATMRANLRLADSLEADSANGMWWSMRYYTTEDHGTVPLKAIHDALRWVFSDYLFPSNYIVFDKQVSPDSAIAVVLQHYKELAKEWGYDVVPQESFINGLGYDLLRYGQEEKAKRFFNYNIFHYPQSANAFDSMGDYYLERNNKAQALTLYRRANELKPSAETQRKIRLLDKK